MRRWSGILWYVVTVRPASAMIVAKGARRNNKRSSRKDCAASGISRVAVVLSKNRIPLKDAPHHIQRCIGGNSPPLGKHIPTEEARDGIRDKARVGNPSAAGE